MDFTHAPGDPLSRILWLTNLYESMSAEIDKHLQTAYFEARMQNRLEAAIEIAPHGKKAVIAMTRAENERRGRMVRWGGL